MLDPHETLIVKGAFSQGSVPLCVFTSDQGLFFKIAPVQFFSEDSGGKLLYDFEQTIRGITKFM